MESNPSNEYFGQYHPYMDGYSLQLAPQLRVLMELAEHKGHMTQAAEALNIPQSTMSRRIHALETALGVPLLVRDGRGVRLTPAALALAEQTRNPLRELDAALANAAGDTDADRGTVRFGFPLTMGSGPVPDVLAEFRRKHPGIRLHLLQAHNSALVDDLRTGSLDIALTIPPPRGLRHTVLASQQIYAALPQHHRLAGRKSVALTELRSETFIANPPAYNLRQVTQEWCLEAGFEPNITVEISEFATIRELIGRELGAALLPKAEHPVPGIVQIPLKGMGYSRDIALAWAPVRPTPVVQRLATFVQEQWISQ